MFDVSVILPNFNHAHYLPDCLERLFSQPSPPKEIIVIDDGSHDNSISVIEDLQKKHSNLRLLKNGVNQGVHKSVNRGIQEAKGTYLAFCAADDVFFPDFFKSCKQAFDLYPDAGLCCGDFATFYDNQPQKVIQLLDTNEMRYITPRDLSLLMKNNCFSLASYTSICRKDLVVKFGSYKSHLTCMADIFLCYQIAFENPVVYVPKLFGSQRILKNSYGQKIRFDFFRRKQLWKSFLEEACLPENKRFYESMVQSRLISIGGYFALLYLILTPKYYHLFPFTLFHVLRRKRKEAKCKKLPM